MIQMFYSSKDPEQVQSVVNEELGKVLKFCAANMLSINFMEKNYIIITSPKKKTNIRITLCSIEQTSQIKYLGVFIDEHLKWDAQLQLGSFLAATHFPSLLCLIQCIASSVFISFLLLLLLYCS